MGKNGKVLVMLCLLFATICCEKKAGQNIADIVLNHGKILTMDPSNPQVEALAAKGSKILAVGSDEEINPYIGKATKVINIEGNLAVPGIIDGHGHFMSLGESLMGLDLRFTETWENIVEMVKVTVQQKKPGEWVVGRGWHQDKWKKPPTPSVEELPIHHSLSATSPESPVMLIHVSGHGVFVNEKAMDLVGISSDTPNPAGGEIVRDRLGNPTGMFRETAQDPIRAPLSILGASISLPLSEWARPPIFLEFAV